MIFRNNQDDGRYELGHHDERGRFTVDHSFRTPEQRMVYWQHVTEWRNAPLDLSGKSQAWTRSLSSR